MKIAISNIAWEKEDDSRVYSLLNKLGVTGLEISPYRIWEDPFSVSKSEIAAYQSNIKKNYNLEVVAMQALLFGHPELTIFESEKKRIQTANYLKKVINFASNFGNIPLVFGSPKNRIIGIVPTDETKKIYQIFFKELGEYSKVKGVRLCIEANPTLYGADFINTLQEAQIIVEEVNSEGFCLHIDTGAMIINKETPEIIAGLTTIPVHYHISEPFLSEKYDNSNFHKKSAKSLMNIGYKGHVSIEMSPKDKKTEITTKITAAIKFAKDCY